MDDVWQDATDDTLHEADMKKRHWNRLQSEFAAQGYRDGLDQGRHVHLQKGFDRGYRSGLQLGERVGHLIAAVMYTICNLL